MDSKNVELYERIQGFSLDEPDAQLAFSKRLARDNNWSLDYAQKAIVEYKKFAFLAVAAGHPVTPSEQVDRVWHLHLIYTKSYWQEFCPNILRTELHHNPTQGGSAEGLKFEDWYCKTLESYQQFFGIPPSDIWSLPRDRFGRELHFAMINTQENWVIPKFSLNPIANLHPKQAIVFSILFLTSAAISSCQVGASNSNPLNYTGSEFLSFYFQLSLLFIFLAHCLRYFLRLPISSPIQPPSSLNPYEIAYLADGDRRVADTAIASFFQRGYITVDPEQRKLNWTGSIAALSNPVEKAVAGSIRTSGHIDSISKSISYSTLPICDRLISWELLIKPQQAFIAKIIPALLIASLLGLGISKILVGISRGKPIGFLVFMCALIAIYGVTLTKRPINRSIHGDRVLKTLRNSTPSKVFGLDDSQLPFVVALLSMAILPNESFADLKQLFIPVSNSNSGSVGDSGGDGGGGCGGGCGGCGGG